MFMIHKTVLIYILSFFALSKNASSDPSDDCQNSKTCKEAKQSIPKNITQLEDLFTSALRALANNDAQAFVLLGMTPEIFEKHCPQHYHKQKIMEELKGIAPYYQDLVQGCFQLFDWSKAEMISSSEILKQEYIVSKDKECDGGMAEMNEVEIIYKVDDQHYAVRLKDPMRFGTSTYIYRFYDGPSCRAISGPEN